MKRMITMMAVCMLSIISVAQTTESLSMADFEITAGETKSVSVELTSETEYVAFQFDLLLPDGLSVASAANGRLDAKLGEDMADDHTLTAQKVSGSDNLYRFVCFSITNSGFLNTSGTIVNLTIQADADVPAGDAVGTIKEIRFAELSAVEHLFDSTTFTVTCNENPSTGINSLTAGKNVKQVYTLDGKQVKTAQKGVNIIRQTDGTTRKVQVK